MEYLAVARIGGRTARRLQSANHTPSMSISLLVDPPVVSIRLLVDPPSMSISLVDPPSMSIRLVDPPIVSIRAGGSS